MSTYATPAFWTAAGERAFKTFAQTAVALALDVSRWENLSISKARALGATGIGYGGVSKTVQHVDFGPTRSWVYSRS